MKVKGQNKYSKMNSQKIYEAAIALFQEKGFESTRISDICQAAKMPVGSVYHYFKNKEAILMEYAHWLGSEAHHILENSTLEQDPVEVIEEYYRFKSRTLEDAGYAICRSINERFDIMWLSNGEYNKYSGVYSLKPFMEKRIAAGQFPIKRSGEEAAWLMQALYEGCINYWLKTEGKESFAELVERRFLPIVIENLTKNML